MSAMSKPHKPAKQKLQSSSAETYLCAICPAEVRIQTNRVPMKIKDALHHYNVEHLGGNDHQSEFVWAAMAEAVRPPTFINMQGHADGFADVQHPSLTPKHLTAQLNLCHRFNTQFAVGQASSASQAMVSQDVGAPHIYIETARQDAAGLRHAQLKAREQDQREKDKTAQRLVEEDQHRREQEQAYQQLAHQQVSGRQQYPAARSTRHTAIGRSPPGSPTFTLRRSSAHNSFVDRNGSMNNQISKNIIEKLQSGTPHEQQIFVHFQLYHDKRVREISAAARDEGYAAGFSDGFEKAYHARLRSTSGAGTATPALAGMSMSNFASALNGTPGSLSNQDQSRQLTNQCLNDNSQQYRTPTVTAGAGSSGSSAQGRPHSPSVSNSGGQAVIQAFQNQRFAAARANASAHGFGLQLAAQQAGGPAYGVSTQQTLHNYTGGRQGLSTVQSQLDSENDSATRRTTGAVRTPSPANSVANRTPVNARQSSNLAHASPHAPAAPAALAASMAPNATSLQRRDAMLSMSGLRVATPADLRLGVDEEWYQPLKKMLDDDKDAKLASEKKKKIVKRKAAKQMSPVKNKKGSPSKSMAGSGSFNQEELDATYEKNTQSAQEASRKMREYNAASMSSLRSRRVNNNNPYANRQEAESGNESDEERKHIESRKDSFSSSTNMFTQSTENTDSSNTNMFTQSTEDTDSSYTTPAVLASSPNEITAHGGQTPATSSGADTPKSTSAGQSSDVIVNRVTLPDQTTLFPSYAFDNNEKYDPVAEFFRGSEKSYLQSGSTYESFEFGPIVNVNNANDVHPMGVLSLTGADQAADMSRWWPQMTNEGTASVDGMGSGAFANAQHGEFELGAPSDEEGGGYEDEEDEEDEEEDDEDEDEEL